MVGRNQRYALADSAQQVVGGFLLAGPFVVTEEVWILANEMVWYNVLATVAIVFAIGYGALYQADAGRDPDREAEVGGIPVRFVSPDDRLLRVGACPRNRYHRTHDVRRAAELGTEPAVVAALTLKATTVGAIFSVVGAATADSVF